MNISIQNTSLNDPVKNCIAIILFMSLISSCSQVNSSGNNASKLDKQDFLNINLRQNISSFAPAELENSSDFFLGRQLFETLFIENANGVFKSRLISDFSRDSIRPIFTFTLANGIKFSDGEALNSSHIKLIFRNIFDLPDPGRPFAKFRNSILGYEDFELRRKSGASLELPRGFGIIDNQSFYLQLKNPEIDILRTLSNLKFAIYKQAVSGELLGTGPFVINRSNSDISMQLIRNPFFILNSEQNYIEGINIRFIKSEDAIFNEFMNGSIHLLDYPATGPKNTGVEQLLQDKYGYYDHVQQSSGKLTFMELHNFDNLADISRILMKIDSAKTDEFVYKRYFEENWLAGVDLEKPKSDSLAEATFDARKFNVLIEKSEYRSLFSDGSDQNFNFSHVKSLEPNLNDEYIVIKEAEVANFNSKSKSRILSELNDIKEQKFKYTAIVPLDYTHDLVVFDEQLSGFKSNGIWSRDVSTVFFKSTSTY